MKNKSNIFWPCALLVFSLAACAPAAQPAADVAEPAAETQPAPAAAETEEVAPVEETAVADVGDDACVNCHTDKDLLIQTADPVVEVEEESSGAG